MGWPRVEADWVTVALLAVVGVLVLAVIWLVAGWFGDAADDDDESGGGGDFVV